MPDTTLLMSMVLIIGALTSAIVQGIKVSVRKLVGPKVWWDDAVFGILPVVLGAAMGQVSGLAEWPWGVAAGAVGGALSSMLYKKLRDIIRSKF